MKKVITLAMALMLCAGAAMADHIALFAEQAGLNCFDATWNPDGASNFVYVIQKFNTGSSACEFMVANPAGAPFSSFTFPTGSGFLAIGDPMLGISVSYPACLATPDIYVMRLRFADDEAVGLAPSPCGKMEIVPDPTAVPPVLQTVDCVPGNPHPATGGSFYWGNGCGGCGEPTATERATWGSIKALYR